MWKLLSLCLLLLTLSCPGWTKRNRCLTRASSCDECIQAGPHCAWCSQPFSSIRCQTPEALQRQGCPKSHIYNPRGEVQVVKKSSSIEATAAESLVTQPQELVVRLRPGVSRSFNLNLDLSAPRPRSQPLPFDISSPPAGVNLAFGNSLGSNTLSVEVSVEADQCHPAVHNSTQLQNRTGPWFVHITALGSSQSVKLEISVECQCDCTKHKQDDSPECNGRGTLQCGQCRCSAPYVGRRCETDTETALSDDRRCRSHPDSPVCSNNGSCVDGVCECRVMENPEERYSGQFCQCTNFLCPRYDNRLCGGRGRCECNLCVCDKGWGGDDCSCYLGSETCMAKNQQVCNGRGYCQCGTCVCHGPRYFGPTCEICPMCLGVCQQKAECVECLAFGTGPKKAVCEEECSDLQVTMVDSQEELTGRHCRMMDHDHRCSIYYSFPEVANSNNVTISRYRECSPY